MPLVLLALAAIVAQAPANPPQAMTDLDREKLAITQTVLDYAEGYYGGEPERMARAVSPYLSKRGLTAPPGVTPFLLQMNADMLIDASNGAKVAPAERRIRVDVLDVNVEVASARVFTAQFNDYLHLVKRSGHWQILNVLWHAPPTAATPDGVEAAVERAVREYQAACFAGDGQRAQAVVHPAANLRTLAPAPQGRPRVIREQNADSIAAALSSGQMKLAGNLEQARIVVDGVDVDIASARLTLGTVPMYLHLATQAGKWRVVNALGYPPPAGPPGATRQPPAGPGPAEVRRIIADGNVDWGRARVTFDRQHFERMLAPDFYVQLLNRKLTRLEFIEQISAPSGPVKLVRFDATVLTVMPNGDGWAAIIHEKLEFERAGDDGRIEKAYALWITRDGWKQVGGQWKIAFSEEIGNELWRGAKPPFKDW